MIRQTPVFSIESFAPQKIMGGKDIRDKLPKYLRSFDKLLRKVNTGYFVGEQVSVVLLEFRALLWGCSGRIRIAPRS